MKRSHLLPCLLVCTVLLTILACTLPSLSASDKPPSTHPDALALAGATIDQVTATSSDSTMGTILTVQITNPATSQVVATLPCGLVFRPEPGIAEQSLMMIQEIVVEIPAGQTVSVTPYVVCIESNRGIPSTGTAYTVGEMSSGDLLKFARCLCDETLPASLTSSPTAFKDMFGIQLAVWVVADGISFDELLTGMSGGQGAVGDLEQVITPVVNLLRNASQQWLDRCDIQVKP